MIYKATRLNEITVGLSGEEEIQGTSTVAFRGQGDEEEATKAEKEHLEKSENPKNVVSWKPSKTSKYKCQLC